MPEASIVFSNARGNVNEIRTNGGFISNNEVSVIVTPMTNVGVIGDGNSGQINYFYVDVKGIDSLMESSLSSTVGHYSRKSDGTFELYVSRESSVDNPVAYILDCISKSISYKITLSIY